jgi:hypothetical protein
MNDRVGIENLDQRARSFWAWFDVVESRLRNLKPDSPMWSELDQRLETLGVEAWEIGPAVASTARHSFTLSPNGDRETYVKTRRIVELAPHLPEWEFLPAKPRKQWSRRFLWSRDRIDIDASGWRFVVYRFNDGLHDIVLVGDVLPSLDPDQQRRVLRFVVESELGEASCIELINALDIVRQPSKDDMENSIPITSLFQFVVAGRNAH